MTARTTVSADFAFRQERYTPWRRFIRDFLLRTLAFNVLARVEVTGLENIPPTGPALLINNHIHAIDPVVIVGAVRTRFVVPMSKVENFSLPIFGALMRRWGAYPVRRGQYDRQAVQNTIDLLRCGHVVLIAPEGTRQPALARAKDGYAYASARTGAVVIPAAIDGTREFTSNLRRLRKTVIRLQFGRPFYFNPSCFKQTGGISRDDLTQMTDEGMYQLARLLPENRRGHYADLSKATTDTLIVL